MDIERGFFRLWFHGRGLNVRRGMFRLWVAISALWVLAVGGFAAQDYLKWSASPGNYQYDPQMKEKPGKDGPASGFYAMFTAPTKTDGPPTFSALTQASVQSYFDEKEKKGEMQVIDFPDNSHLYLDADLTGDDKTYLSKTFWGQQEHRKLEKLLPWVGWAHAPPVALLILGGILAWVARGFAA